MDTLPDESIMAQKYAQIEQEVQSEQESEDLHKASIEALKDSLSESELYQLLAVSLTQTEIDKAISDEVIIKDLIREISLRMAGANTKIKSFLDFGIKVVNGELIEADLTQSKKALTLASLVTTQSKIKHIASVIKSTPASVAWYKTEYKSWIEEAKIALSQGGIIDFINAKRY